MTNETNHGLYSIPSLPVICTGMGEHKAVAWAALVHSEKNPDRSITDVNIESLGKVTPEGEFFMDRFEG